MKVRAAILNQAFAWALAVTALSLSAGALVLWCPGRPIGWPLMLLAGLCLAAECLPVEVERRSVHFTFTLPFVAAIALTTGQSAALLVSVGAALAASWVLALIRARQGSAAKPGFLTTTWNLSSTAVSAVAAGTVVVAAGLDAPSSDVGAAISAFVYTACYGLVNFLLTALCVAETHRRRPVDPVLAALKAGIGGYLLYGLVSAAVAVLAVENCYWAVPGTAIPLLALRAALAFRAGAYEHYYETITALTLMMQRAHPYTHGHLQRVADYAEQVAVRLGFGPRHARLIREASVLHDVGKIAVDEQVLDKPGRLTEDEMRHVRLHAELGAAILAPVKPFEAIVPWVRHHHERPDGRGYPDRMLDVEIPVESKIIAVADAFDAMTMNELNGELRPYRHPMTVEEALDELDRCAGTQFDPHVVAVFRAVVVAEGRA